jgi:pantothenate synthetase
MRTVVKAQLSVELEYAACVRQSDLSVPDRVNCPVLLAVAARLGATRLIDNLPVVPPAEEDDT